MKRRASFWSRTPVAILVGVASFTILALVWQLVAVAVWLSLSLWVLKDFQQHLLAIIALALIPDVGFVILARIIAFRLSGGKAALLTTLITGALALLNFWRALAAWPPRY